MHDEPRCPRPPDAGSAGQASLEISDRICALAAPTSRSVPETSTASAVLLGISNAGTERGKRGRPPVRPPVVYAQKLT
jgi:hypothetical protein